MSWQKLIKMTNGEPFRISRVTLPESRISIDGDFEVPPLAALSFDDQVFVAAFVKTHGSIKEMERLFGVSYPTIKNRLNKISELMGFNDLFSGEVTAQKTESPVDRLARGDISIEEAIEEMRKG